MPIQSRPEIMIIELIAPLVVALIFITLCSLFREPNRQNFSALLIAGAGAAYLNGGLLGWEFAFCNVMTGVAYFGLKDYRFIGIGWLSGDDVSDLIITCDHAIGDGMSVVFLLRDILQAIGFPDRPLAVLPKQPPYEHLVPPFQYKLPLSFEPSLVTTNTKPTLPENSRPRLHAWSLSTIETSTFVSACKQAQTSVHATICAAFLLAIRHTQNGDFDETTPLKCFCAIDLRPFLPTIAEDFGAYFTFVLTANKVDPDRSVWELARSIKSQIDFKTTPAQIFAHIPKSEAFIATLPSPDEVVIALETVNRYDLNVSNLGRLKIDRQYREFQLTAVYGPAITNHMDRAAIVGVATLGERMFFSLVCPESDFSSAQIDRLQQTVMQFLN
jgi:Family of unknown function (DUF6010)